MKLSLAFFLFFNLTSALAIVEQKDEAIYSIDTKPHHSNYVEASEAALPAALYETLRQQMGLFRFTLLEEAAVEELFESLEQDPQARMKKPGGACAYRRYYVQMILKKKKLITGQLLIECPANDGKLRLKDQVSGHHYTFSNFHDANIVAINTNAGVEFRVLDFQFEDRPLTLHEYLGEVEATQKKLYPLKTKSRGSVREKCYWSVSTDYLTFKK